MDHPKAAEELTDTYWYLRAVENRLQMLRDEQTHIMPETPEAVAEIGRLMGEADAASFEHDYRAALERVARHYASLFTEGETLGSGEGSLVFTGSDDDPETLDTLMGLGFTDPSKAIATVRKWHYGGYAATRTSAARAHLTELLPASSRRWARPAMPTWRWRASTTSSGACRAGCSSSRCCATMTSCGVCSCSSWPRRRAWPKR